jgi:hypothetical protein
MIRISHVILLVTYLLSVVLAAYPPRSPLQGSYTWQVVISGKSGPIAETGGRTLYDYISGYVRMESWNSTDPTPGINGVTIWDLRETTPVVWTIDSQASCVVQKLNDNNTAPMPPDWTGFTLQQVTYFNRALSEEWTDGYGGVVYVDVFSRDIVGMGNYSTSDDGTTLFYNIQSWSDAKPDGTAFLLPNTIQCKPIASIEADVSESKVQPHGALINLGCTACQAAIGIVLSRICGGAGAAACAPFPPAVPFCSVLAGAGCGMGKHKACQIIKKC